MQALAATFAALAAVTAVLIASSAIVLGGYANSAASSASAETASLFCTATRSEVSGPIAQHAGQGASVCSLPMP